MARRRRLHGILADVRVSRRSWGRWAAAGAIGVVAVGLFVHFSERVVTAPIVDVVSIADARLLVGAGCGSPSAVGVRESARTVRVQVRDRVPRWGGASAKCLTVTCIRLARALGSRAVVDDATGRTVRVAREQSARSPLRCVTPSRGRRSAAS
jgi:hypothetical protein